MYYTVAGMLLTCVKYLVGCPAYTSMLPVSHSRYLTLPAELDSLAKCTICHQPSIHVQVYDVPLPSILVWDNTCVEGFKA